MPVYLHKKLANSVLWMILISIMAVLSLIYVTHYASETMPLRQTAAAPFQAQTLHEIKGFSFKSVANGKTVLFISADRLSIDKKKIGFIRFALMKEARLENVLIKLYSLENTVNSAHRKAQPLRFDFESLASNASLSPTAVKKISGIVCEPVWVELYDPHTMLTRIQADSATFVGRKNQVLFKGRVCITSSEKTLTAGNVVFNPRSGAFGVDGSYILQTQNSREQGRRLKTDVFLNPLTYALPPTSKTEMMPVSRGMKGREL